MSIVDRKLKFLQETKNVGTIDTMLLTVADISTVLTTPKMYNEFYGIILEDHLVLHKINSKGLFKKEFFMDDETHKLMFNKF